MLKDFIIQLQKTISRFSLNFYFRSFCNSGNELLPLVMENRLLVWWQAREDLVHQRELLRCQVSGMCKHMNAVLGGKQGTSDPMVFKTYYSILKCFWLLQQLIPGPQRNRVRFSCVFFRFTVQRPCQIHINRLKELPMDTPTTTCTKSLLHVGVWALVCFRLRGQEAKYR